MNRSLIACVLVMLLAACSEPAQQALGTLEYDRITLPAPAAERIVEIAVREGEQVQAGARVLTLEQVRGDAQLAAAQAEVALRRQALAELRNGARTEDIEQARAHLAAATAQARDAGAYYRRVSPLGQKQLVAASEVDRARAAAANAQAQVAAAQAALAELRNGTRPEQVAQAQAALAAAEAHPRPRPSPPAGSICSPRAPAASTACRTGSATRRRSARRWRCCWSATLRMRACTCPRRCVRRCGSAARPR